MEELAINYLIWISSGPLHPCKLLPLLLRVLITNLLANKLSFIIIYIVAVILG